MVSDGSETDIDIHFQMIIVLGIMSRMFPDGIVYAFYPDSFET